MIQNARSLEARSLMVTVPGRPFPLLSDVSLALTPGEVLGVVGPNGAGKSTLLACLAGLRKPNAGTVLLTDIPLPDIALAERARRIAYLPQAQPLHWPLTVERVVALGRLPHRGRFAGESALDRAAIDRALTATDMDGLRDRRVDTLSGGERARAMLARALATEAPILLADEPVAALDPAQAKGMMALFRSLARQSGLAVAVTLHDLAAAARWCDRIVLLSAGRVAAAGAPAEVLTPRHLSDVYAIDARLETIGDVPVMVVR